MPLPVRWWVTMWTSMSPDARIVEMQSQSNRLILHLHTPAGDEVDIIDIDDGHVISRIKTSK